MARLIDADEFLKNEIERCGCVPLVGSCSSDNEIFKFILDQQPTVDAVEVVHGEWIGLISEDFVCAEGFNTGMTEKQKGKCLEDFYHRTHCSICNCCFDDRDVKNWNYCPNCGSKIDGGKRDEM
jgi:hypothetical protein